MKTMTCGQMGGPCDSPISGATPEEMIKNGEAHVREEAEKGDAAHEEVLVMMEKTSKDPEAGKVWMDKFMADYAALPED